MCACAIYSIYDTVYMCACAMYSVYDTVYMCACAIYSVYDTVYMCACAIRTSHSKKVKQSRYRPGVAQRVPGS
jgi:hypothetical protein